MRINDKRIIYLNLIMIAILVILGLISIYGLFGVLLNLYTITLLFMLGVMILYLSIKDKKIHRIIFYVAFIIWLNFIDKITVYVGPIFNEEVAMQNVMRKHIAIRFLINSIVGYIPMINIFIMLIFKNKELLKNDNISDKNKKGE